MGNFPASPLVPISDVFGAFLALWKGQELGLGHKALGPHSLHRWANRARGDSQISPRAPPEPSRAQLLQKAPVPASSPSPAQSWEMFLLPFLIGFSQVFAVWIYPARGAKQGESPNKGNIALIASGAINPCQSLAPGLPSLIPAANQEGSSSCQGKGRIREKASATGVP